MVETFFDTIEEAPLLFCSQPCPAFVGQAAALEMAAGFVRDGAFKPAVWSGLML
jgi:hypothetical protein